MALTAAEAFRDAACGRVVAMLSKSSDAQEATVRRLTSALDAAEPVVVPKPEMRLDMCVAMIFVGVLVGLAIRWVQEARAAGADDAAGGPDDDPHDDDAKED